MTLEEASAAALEAARTGNLDSLALALSARAAALARGQLPTADVLAAGEHIAELLRDLIRDTALDAARLRQLELTVESTPEPSIRIDL